MYLDSIQDVLTDPINVSTIQAVEDLQKEYAATVSTFQGKQSALDEIVKECDDLSALGVTVTVTNTRARWEQTQASSESRKTQLEAALVKQNENDTRCRQFADKAAEADAWLAQSTATLASDSGDLESQLASIQSLDVEAGNAFVEELSQIAEKLAADDVRVNPHTDKNVPSIRARVAELSSSKKTKESLIEKEILAKKNSTASPEQIAEFKEVFAHFDKNHNNSLNTSEFKSCLQSLGEDPTDTQMESLMSSLAHVKVEKAGEEVSQVGFEDFLAHMIKITSDTTTENEVSAAFKEIGRAHV